MTVPIYVHHIRQDVADHLPRLQAVAEFAYVPVESDDALASRLADQVAAAAVIGGETNEAMTTLKLVCAADPNVAVVLLCEASRRQALMAACQRADGVSKHVSVVAYAAFDALRQAIEAPARNTAKRRAYAALTQAVASQITGALSPREPLVYQTYFERLFDAAPLGIVLTDAAQRVEAVNPKACELLEVQPHEVAGRPLTTLLGDYLGDLRLDVDQQIKPHTYTVEATHVAKQRWVEISLSPIEAHSSNAANGIMVLLNDISEQRLAEQKRHDVLIQALSIRDEFISVCSHELRTPLTAMKLQVQAWERKAAKQTSIPQEAVVSFLKQEHALIGRLARIVEDMLDVERIRSGSLALQPAPSDFAQIIERVVTQMQPALDNAHCELRTHIPAGLRGVWDGQRLEQVIINLLSNATKYGHGAPIELSVELVADNVLLVVRDQGRGIPFSDQKRIFARFERAVVAREASGLGLGLYIAAQIVRQHAGRIWVESEPGHGAAFYVELPFVPAVTESS